MKREGEDMNKMLGMLIFVLLLFSNVNLLSRNLDYANQRTPEEQELIEVIFDGDLSRAGPLMKKVKTTKGAQYILKTAQDIYDNWKFMDSFAIKALDQSYSKNKIKQEFESRKKEAKLKHNAKLFNYKKLDCQIALDMIQKIINGKNKIIRTANATYLKMHIELAMPKYSQMVKLVEKRLQELENGQK